MKAKKSLFLFLALILPICIFIFLKFFGRNEFDVPLLHQKAIENKPTSCYLNYTLPYVLSDSIITLLNPMHRKGLLVVNFDSASTLNRILEQFPENINVVQSHQLKLSDEKLNFVKQCILLTPPPNTVVLIDEQKRIRGYYPADDREEIDRLIVEMKIILKQY
jgi:hypothetical protein